MSFCTVFENWDVGVCMFLYEVVFRWLIKVIICVQAVSEHEVIVLGVRVLEE